MASVTEADKITTVADTLRRRARGWVEMPGPVLIGESHGVPVIRIRERGEMDDAAFVSYQRELKRLWPAPPMILVRHLPDRWHPGVTIGWLPSFAIHTHLAPEVIALRYIEKAEDKFFLRTITFVGKKLPKIAQNQTRHLERGSFGSYILDKAMETVEGVEFFQAKLAALNVRL